MLDVWQSSKYASSKKVSESQKFEIQFNSATVFVKFDGASEEIG